jgi:hypothetical protein
LTWVGEERDKITLGLVMRGGVRKSAQLLGGSRLKSLADSAGTAKKFYLAKSSRQILGKGWTRGS